ncbi:hypothetical protein ACFO4E_29365 [Nocardiopsis mangrovi]|uniref:Histidine kinase/HSP90-like ATPase domain-containing protein n=1 Tax=Nocardiopsis mangrovi TaxID=1179818 RepID=A0ABV9E5M5_9ACTN
MHGGFGSGATGKGAAYCCNLASGLPTLRYTASGRGGIFTVTLRVDAWRITIEVDDEGRPAGGTLPFIRPITPMAQHGRGMTLIDYIADTWGPLPHPRTGLTFTLTHRPTYTAPAA